MKRLALIFTAAFVSILLSGCVSLVYKTEIDTDMVSVKDDMEAEELPEQVQTDTYDETSAKKAFAEALENMINNRVFPDGSGIDTFYENDTFENNEFAVFDVDADGRDELIIRFTDTFMAAMSEQVYGYDSESGSLITEIYAFPNLIYYDNGTISEGISHNQGWAGRFWPYAAYKHNSETDTYEEEIFIDACDGEYFAEWGDLSFPTKVDKDGDLLVYIMGPDYENGYYTNPVDGDVYESWFDEFFGKEIEIPFVNITTENINALK